MVDTGSNAYVKYAYQNDYNTVMTAPNLIFGKDQKVNGLTWMTNQQEVSQLNTPEIQNFVYGKNEGKCSIDYTLSNPWIFASVLNSNIEIPGNDDPDDLSITEYEHKWTSDPIVNKKIKNLRPLTVDFGFDANGIGTGKQLVRRAIGVNTTTLNLKTAVNDKVSVSQSLEWANQISLPAGSSSIPSNEKSYSFDSTPEAPAWGPPGAGIDDEFIPLMFHHASLETPDGTTLAQVQDVDLTIDTGSAQWYGLGHASGVDLYRRLLKITGKFSLAVQNSSQFDKVLLRPDKAAMDLYIRISNGQSGTSAQTINIKCEKVGFGEHTTSYEPGEPIIENLPFQAGRVNIFSNVPGNITRPNNA